MSGDRLLRLLAERISRAEGEPGERITVAELRRELLPYPLCRRELDFATKAEYDLAMLDLLSDPEVLSAPSDELREAIRRERETPEPGVAFLSDHAAAFLEPGPRLRDAVNGGAGTERVGATGGNGGTKEERAGSTDASPSPDARGAERRGESVDPTADAGECWSCARELPARADLQFCPFCGSDQLAPECAECGAELESGWSFCPACGSRTHA